MKRFISYLWLVGCLGIPGALAEAPRPPQSPPFDQYPPVRSVSECKEVDFNSYHRAQDHKSHLLRDNPERSHPNYGGKYLLLKQELLMETLWLIVDCETGKFYKEYLRGKVEFNPKSRLLVLSQPNGNAPPEYQVWTGNEWTRVDRPEEAASAAPVTAGSSSAAPASVPPESYDDLFKKYPVARQSGCHELDFNSFFRAQSAKGNLQKLNPNRSQPNFAGKYLLLKNELMFETIWLIADCETGQFLPRYLKGSLEFRPDSGLVLIRDSSEFPRLALWRDQRFVDLLNPRRTGHQTVENEVFDTEASALFRAIAPNEKDPRASFEKLQCGQQGCSVVTFPDAKPRLLNAEQSRLARTVLERWGAEMPTESGVVLRIDEGKCGRDKNPVCQIRLNR